MKKPPIKDLLYYSLSYDDMKELFYPKKINIILYHEIKKYKHIDDLFLNSDFNYCIVFFPIKSEFVGHWIAILKHNNYYEYFDPYKDNDKDGILTPDEQRKWMKKNIIKKLNLEQPNLTNLFIKSGVNSIMCNPYPFQTKSDKINTCGRHVATRLHYNNMDIEQYWNFIKKSKIDPDIFVVNFTYKIIKK